MPVVQDDQDMDIDRGQWLEIPEAPLYEEVSSIISVCIHKLIYISLSQMK